MAKRGRDREVETPAGAYALEAEWFVDATGANSRIRDALGLETHPSRHTDRWCISDVRFKKPYAAERWTWIDAPFNEGRAVWQHLMADAVWRLDYQMDEHADPESISRPEVAGARLREQLGPEVEFEFVWIGPYQYRDHLLDSFRVGRTIFVGDSAHVVCPFGARGGNNGIQDAANLGWKLALVLQGRAGEALVDSYHHERHAAAVENLRVTSRTARFLAPRSAAEHRLRRAVVALARTPRVRAPARQHRPDGAGERLSALAVGARGRALAAERRARGTTVMRLLGDGTSLPRPLARRPTTTTLPGRCEEPLVALRPHARAPMPGGRGRAPRRGAGQLRPRPSRRLRRGPDRGADGGAHRGRPAPRPGAGARRPHEQRPEHQRSRRLLRGLDRRPRGARPRARAPTSTRASCSCSPTRSASCRCCSTASSRRARRQLRRRTAAPPARAARLHRGATRLLSFLHRCCALRRDSASPR